MKATGIVRRIDDLGRVVIPKEIRRTLRIKEGDPLEIYKDHHGEVILKKYSTISELTDFAKEYAEVLAQSSGHAVCITDRDQVVAAGGGRKDCVGKIISEQLGTVIQERNQVLSGENGKHYVKVTLDEYGGEVPQVICPILCQGDAIGSVILLSRDSRGRMGETEEVLARCAAGFLGRQMGQ